MNIHSEQKKRIDGQSSNDKADSSHVNELIDHARNGDKQAFIALILAYENVIRSIIRSFIRTITGYEEDELVNEIIMRAYQIIPDFKGRAVEFKSWLRRTTWGICYNIKEKQKREREKEPETTDILQYTSRSIPQNPATIYAEKEIKICVHKAIDLLPEKFRKVVILKNIDGFRYEDIAKILGIPMGTVKTWLMRGREQLRKLLEDLGYDDLLDYKDVKS